MRKADSSFLFVEHFEVAPKRHAVLVMVQEVWHSRGRRLVGAQHLVFLVQSPGRRSLRLCGMAVCRHSAYQD